MLIACDVWASAASLSSGRPEPYYCWYVSTRPVRFSMTASLQVIKNVNAPPIAAMSTPARVGNNENFIPGVPGGLFVSAICSGNSLSVRCWPFQDGVQKGVICFSSFFSGIIFDNPKRSGQCLLSAKLNRPLKSAKSLGRRRVKKEHSVRTIELGN